MVSVYLKIGHKQASVIKAMPICQFNFQQRNGREEIKGKNVVEWRKKIKKTKTQTIHDTVVRHTV